MTEVLKQWEGQVVDGGFHLGQCLGGCDHSAVFLTQWGGQRAAIKLVRVDPEDAEARLARWQQAAKLSHPHLIRLYGMGRCGTDDAGLVYVVMEYAEEDLSQVLPQRPLTADEAREMLEPALDGLAYLHGNGFAHGRLKPSNLLAIDSRLKLSSDGLCPIGESLGPMGSRGVYDAPEIASGPLSPSADVWPLGITLVEALTQHVPVWQGVERPELVVPETLPTPFREIARQCLQRDPQRRCTVAEIQAWLRPGGLPVPQAPATASLQIALPKKRYVAAAAAFGVVLATVIAGPKLFTRQAEPERGPAVRVEQPRVPPVADPPAAASVPGEVIERVLPDVPSKARNTIRGGVRVGVRVQVDALGNVAAAKLDSSGPSRYFAGLALEAARRWRFAPATVDGRAAPSEWVLRFEFLGSGTEVVPVRVRR